MLADTSQTAGSSVAYRVIAMADAHDGAAASAPSDPSLPVTLSGTAGTALAGSGPTNPAITSITRPAPGSGGTTLNVSTQGSDSNTCGPVASPCKTISQAITNAAAGDTVSVGPGTYHELVVVPKQLTLLGFGATVNAAGLSQGSGQTMDASAIFVTAAGSRVEGFTVHGAFGEGILVLNTSNVVLAGDTVSGNNLGKPGNTSYGECQVNGEIPGDCGEGIHLMTATGSNVVDNVSDSNSGGMLVTDELGPNTGNTINGNLVQNNADDCGITLPSHNPNALDANGVPQPTMGGVFANTVSNNMSLNNGLNGFGAGILFAAAGPGMASYNNTVTGNIINGNGIAGIAIHSHTPNQNVSGDVIQNNIIGQNNLLGDGEFQDFVTTGIAVTSAAVPTTETINGNTIYNNVKQIFTTNNVTIA
jgi:hypothetical protein